ncbi:acyl carrier protein [Nocardia puris]|uniref:Acyl carrier protein n=1 Tax=Nocardia puris TaxID=208602 RepID=A0A366E2E1_9NOCA|nr:phosphopantetheine-binding protein [Nocardia puris]MBF6212641.1 acyl carrier protein [Nocardia puris]MBF6369221.1 acyl carrier protein [Nocardia puris]MBF6461230.1 acyl carrier protein [Nocardia puris]RBO96541.1 acyl carrier protein [Nocardia puris]
MTDVTYRELAELLDQHFPEFAGEVGEDTTYDDLDLDSLVLVELAVVVSKKFGVVISEEDVFDAKGFRALAEVVNRRRREGPVGAAVD